MKFVLFYHSLASCWNHGNAHFLRGIARDLMRRGHDVCVLEPEDGWSRKNLIRRHGPEAIHGYRKAYPELVSETYPRGCLHFDAALEDADVVIVHEWTDPRLIEALGRKRSDGARFRLFFHDTHHRAVTAPGELDQLDLGGYDGVLVFGEVLRDIYMRRGWARRVFTWHEAADITVFHPRGRHGSDGDLVWIGNWGDGERGEELNEFLIGPAAACGLDATVYGVRYPREARTQLRQAGISYGGWLPNDQAPEIFAGYLMTVHVPRRPYARALPGIPTIRMFEAMACGIPLISAPWNDVEGLFPEGSYLKARNGAEMAAHMRALRNDAALAEELSAAGLRAICERHTCSHRVDELFRILDTLETAPLLIRSMEAAL